MSFWQLSAVIIPFSLRMAKEESSLSGPRKPLFLMNRIARSIAASTIF